MPANHISLGKGSQCLALGWCAVGLCCFSAFGQTNGVPDLGRHFCVSHLELRPLEANLGEHCAQPLQTEPPHPESKTSAFSGQFSTTFSPSTVSRSQSDLQEELFHRMDRAGYFERPPRPPDSPVLRWAQGTFQPEEVRVGKTKLTCSVYTALKRKNPLCLLNPVFFQLSW